MSENRSCDSNDNILYDNVFFGVIRNKGESIQVRRGSKEEDLAFVAAVNSGLLLPSHTTKILVSRHRVRGGGGGGANKSFQTMQREEDIISNNNPIKIITSWFIHDLSAPLAAVPTWHGLLCSYLREQKETKLQESQWCLLTKWD